MIQRNADAEPRLLALPWRPSPVYSFFLSSPLDTISTLSGEEIAAHVVLLMVFPLAGLVLSVIGIRLEKKQCFIYSQHEHCCSDCHIYDCGILVPLTHTFVSAFL